MIIVVEARTGTGLQRRAAFGLCCMAFTFAPAKSKRGQENNLDVQRKIFSEQLEACMSLRSRHFTVASLLTSAPRAMSCRSRATCLSRISAEPGLPQAQQ